MYKQKFFEAFFSALNVRGFTVDHDLLYFLIQTNIDDDCKCLVLPWLSYLDRSYDPDKFEDILMITDTWEDAWVSVFHHGAKYVGYNEYLQLVYQLFS